jgi:hypothetical protein
VPETLTGTLTIIPDIDTGPFIAKRIARVIRVVDGKWVE